MRILLIEDDENLVGLLTHALSNQRYVVDVALDGETGWELAQVYPYTLILLDVNLPQLDGITLCRRLRECNTQTLVMLLTARDSITDRVVGLNSGADDYVVKPFDITELLARIRALIRREPPGVPSVLTCGALELNSHRREVTFAGQPFPVSRKEYLLVELFLRHQQRVFSRNDIIDHLWSVEEDPPAQDTVKSHIKSLRHKLKRFNSGDWIETLYGQGYRVNPKYLGKNSDPGTKSQAQSEYTLTNLLTSDLKTRLNAIAKEIDQRNQPENLASHHPHRARILQVDSDPQVLLLGNTLFSYLGFHFTSLEDASQLWAMLKSDRPDILILENHGPDVNGLINGLELCRSVRQNPYWHTLPIIILTSPKNTNAEQQAFLAGADDLIAKPIQPEDFVLRVLNRLQRSRCR